MSLWWIVAAALIVAAVALVVIKAVLNCYNYDWLAIPALLCGAAAAFILLICAACSISAPREMYLFEQQKEFLENYEPTDAVENAAITAKIAELNEWLFSARYSVENWPAWTFYDEAVLDLEPIARK